MNSFEKVKRSHKLDQFFIKIRMKMNWQAWFLSMYFHFWDTPWQKISRQEKILSTFSPNLPPILFVLPPSSSYFDFFPSFFPFWWKKKSFSSPGGRVWEGVWANLSLDVNKGRGNIFPFFLYCFHFVFASHWGAPESREGGKGREFHLSYVTPKLGKLTLYVHTYTQVLYLYL